MWLGEAVDEVDKAKMIEGLRTLRGSGVSGAELPVYQFQRKVYWVEERRQQQQQQQQGGAFKLIGQKVFLEEGKDGFLANEGLIRGW